MAIEPDQRPWREKIDDVRRKRCGWIDGWILAFAVIGAATVLALLAFALSVRDNPGGGTIFRLQPSIHDLTRTALRLL